MLHITKTEYFEFSKKLISINTVSKNTNLKCSSLIAEKLETLGFTVFIDSFIDQHGVSKSQVIAKIGPDVKDGLILSGHIDTVPFENQPGWDFDALKLQIKNDKLFGRGTCDMKLFIAQCIEVFSNIDLTKLKKPIVCIFTADEEIGCLGSKHLKNNLPKIKKTILGDTPLPSRAIIGEPTSFDIINTHKGMVFFDLEINGVAGHSSRPDLGRNSIEPLGKIISLINNLNLEFENNIDSNLKKLFPDFPLNYIHIATVTAGHALNMIPEKTKLQISYRCFPGQDTNFVFNRLKKELSNLELSLSYSFKNYHEVPAMIVAQNIELEKCLQEVLQKDQLNSVSFATDGSFLSMLGIDCYVCGPGEIKMAHQPNEYMPLKDFINGPKIIENILSKLLF